MYESLKGWMNVPATRKPFLTHTGAGAKTFGPSIGFLCYPASKVTLVTNARGEQVSSSTQLYIDGSTAFEEHDEVEFNGRTWPIKAIASFWRDGVEDIKVLYL